MRNLNCKMSQKQKKNEKRRHLESVVALSQLLRTDQTSLDSIESITNE